MGIISVLSLLSVLLFANIIYAKAARSAEVGEENTECREITPKISDIDLSADKDGTPQKLFSFSTEKDCKNESCIVSLTYLPTNDVVANFPRGKLFCDSHESFTSVDDEPEDGCPTEFMEKRRRFNFHDPSSHAEKTTIIIQLVEAKFPTANENCFGQDWYEGPNVLEFTNRYSGKGFVAYVYEIDDYQNRNQKVSNGRLYLKY